VLGPRSSITPLHKEPCPSVRMQWEPPRFLMLAGLWAPYGPAGGCLGSSGQPWCKQGSGSCWCLQLPPLVRGNSPARRPLHLLLFSWTNATCADKEKYPCTDASCAFHTSAGTKARFALHPTELHGVWDGIVVPDVGVKASPVTGLQSRVCFQNFTKTLFDLQLLLNKVSWCSYSTFIKMKKLLTV